MNIVKKNDCFFLSGCAQGAVAKLLPAMIVEDGQEFTLEPLSADGSTLRYALGQVSIADQFTDLGSGLFRVRRKITNHDSHRHYIKSIFQLETAFKPEHYMVPCVNYNGNEFGNRDTPTGLERDGQPWVYAYDRMGIPSCTVSEGADTGVCLFASNESADSLRSSCSMFLTPEGTMCQRVFHPVTEAPYSYSSKRIMTKAYEEYMTLIPGGVKQFEMYIFTCTPMWKNYTYANLLDRALEIFRPYKTPHLSLDRVWDLGIAYNGALLTDCHGTTMSYTNHAPRLFAFQHMVKITQETMGQLMQDPYYTVLGKFGNRFEIGWADQGAMNARMRAVDGWKKGDQAQLKQAEQMLDNWVASQRDNGLLYPQYQNNFPDDTSEKAMPDACNMGWAMTELTRSYQFFRSIGIDKPEYLEFVRKLCQFALTHFSEEYGFGKTWDLDGNPLLTTGTVGGFMISGLLVAYEELPKQEYLDLAKKAMDFYFARDLDQFVCAAGALDCTSTDKETAFPFVRAALALYRFTKEEKYLQMALKSAYYFTSWMYHYDCLYPADSEFTKFGYYTTGGTAISTEHHAIDAWGVVIIPELMELYHITGDERWRLRAQLMWSNGLLGIAAEEGASYHGQIRPLGSQNEGYFGCRWTKYRPTCEERGHFNDCLAGWMGAYRMQTILQLKPEDRAYFE